MQGFGWRNFLFRTEHKIDTAQCAMRRTSAGVIETHPGPAAIPRTLSLVPLTSTRGPGKVRP